MYSFLNQRVDKPVEKESFLEKANNSSKNLKVVAKNKPAVLGGEWWVLTKTFDHLEWREMFYLFQPMLQLEPQLMMEKL